MYQYTSNPYSRAQQKWQRKPLSSNKNCPNVNINTSTDQFKTNMEIDLEERKFGTAFPYIAEIGNESPESMIFDESKETYDEEMKSPEPQIKVDQDLTYDEITALLGSNTEKEDYLTQLFEEEKKKEISFCKENNQNERFLDFRFEVLHSILSAVKKCQLDSSTADRALYYFDKLCVMNECDYDCIHFIAFLCLWISCKYNETANTMPHIRKLIKSYTNNQSFKSFEIESFTNCEKKILSKLNFKLKSVLPIHFIEYYLHCNDSNYCCLYPNDKRYDPINNKLININPSSMAKNMMTFVRFFTDIVNENYSLCNNYKPSILAACIIFCARKSLRITPYLNKDYMFDLFAINNITNEMDACFNKLWSDYVNKFPKQAKGFENLENKSLINI